MTPFIDLSNELVVTIDNNIVSVKYMHIAFVRLVIDGLMLLDECSAAKEKLLARGNPAFVLETRKHLRYSSRTHLIFEGQVYTINNFRSIDITVSRSEVSDKDKSAIMGVAVKLLQSILG